MISLVRIDDRVIHGQTTVTLISEYPCDGILVVSDEIAADEVMKTVYKSVVPNDIKVLVFSVDTAVTKLVEAEASLKKYFVVFKSILDLQLLLKKGYVLKGSILAGPSSVREGTRTFVQGFALTDSEIDAFNFVEEQGIEIIIHPVFTQKKLSWQQIKNK